MEKIRCDYCKNKQKYIFDIYFDDLVLKIRTCRYHLERGLLKQSQELSFKSIRKVRPTSYLVPILKTPQLWG
jgi:hypothetical protein